MVQLNKNLIPLAIIIAGLSISGALVYINQGGGSENGSEILSPQEAGEKAIEFINQNILQEEITASLVSAEEENGVYRFRLKIEEQEYDSYITKNGKLLFLEGIDISSSLTNSEEGNTEEVSKQDTPDVKLFVMSYCPYGLQAQKMFLPVYDLLKNKAEMGVYFVYYIMHEKKEIDENLRQYCIQKEEKEKYSDYLYCFVVNGDSESCLSEANINRTKLSNCITETDSQYSITDQYNDQSTWLSGTYPLFNVHLDLNQKYGIKGSPTVVINDQVVTVSPRSPEKFKEIICQTFSSPPEECSQVLSEEAFSPGFGLMTTSSSSGGQCQ